MRIGIPREIKDQEGRVAQTPRGVQRLVEAGHEVRIERGAGLGSGFGDEEYQAAGGVLVGSREAWASDLVLKVKEPLESEYEHIRNQMLFTFLHLAGISKRLTELLLVRGTTALAYETLEDAQGGLPLLRPMSAIAGNMAAVVGAHYLARPQGGKGVQLGRVAGSRHGRVLVLGDGTVGLHAAHSAHGLGAEVVLAGLDPVRGAKLEDAFEEGFRFILSEPKGIAEVARESDLIVGAVLRRGARAEFLIGEPLVRTLKPGTVAVDVSIDQGGCIETSRVTSHSDPVRVVHGVTHYAVPNMPGAYPRTSTLALAEAVLPYALRLANEGIDALRGDAGFSKALNVYQGCITHPRVAEAWSFTRNFREFPGGFNPG